MTTLLKQAFNLLLVLCGVVLFSPGLRAQECSLGSLAGAYGFTLAGTNVGLGVQFAIGGRFTADGEGKFHGNGTESVSGQVFRTSFTGTYEIDAECTGSATLTFEGGDNAHLDFVLVSSGDEVMLIDSDSGTVETGVAKKQFPQHPDKKTTRLIVPNSEGHIRTEVEVYQEVRGLDGRLESQLDYGSRQASIYGSSADTLRS